MQPTSPKGVLRKPLHFSPLLYLFLLLLIQIYPLLRPPFHNQQECNLLQSMRSHFSLLLYVLLSLSNPDLPFTKTFLPQSARMQPTLPNGAPRKPLHLSLHIYYFFPSPFSWNSYRERGSHNLSLRSQQATRGRAHPCISAVGPSSVDASRRLSMVGRHLTGSENGGERWMRGGDSAGRLCLSMEIGKGGQRMQITGSRGLPEPGGSRRSTDRKV